MPRAAHQQSLDLMARVVLANRTTLDCALAERGGVYVTANTTCCTWIHSSGEVEIQLHKIRE